MVSWRNHPLPGERHYGCSTTQPHLGWCICVCACQYGRVLKGVGRVNDEAVPLNYAQRVGERPRAVRQQKHLSLQAVEPSSHREFKASVLGAYERGERAISVPRLQRLAEIYEVPGDQLLPRELDGEISLVDAAIGAGVDLNAGFAIDLVRLHELDDPDAQILSRF